jgi:hypothetical protein
MAADKRAFDIATAPFGANASEFREVSKMVAASDTLSIFLREMRAGYPELSAVHGADQMAPGQTAPQKAAARNRRRSDRDRLDFGGSAQAEAVNRVAADNTAVSRRKPACLRHLARPEEKPNLHCMSPLSRLATRVAYASSQVPRRAWYAGHSSHAAIGRTGAASGGRRAAEGAIRSRGLMRRVDADRAALFEQDLANVEAGLYPLPADHDGSLFTLLDRSRLFFKDLPELAERATATARTKS